MNRTEQAMQVASVTGSDIDAAIQDERMIELERRAALIEEQRLQVIANTAVIREQSDVMHALRVRCTDRVECIVALERLTDRLVKRQAVNDKRIEKLETCAMINAGTIGRVAELRRVVAEQSERIERLETALREMICNLIDSNISLLSKSRGYSTLNDKLIQALNDIYRQLEG